jgi:hypothetical protein
MKFMVGIAKRPRGPPKTNYVERHLIEAQRLPLFADADQSACT